MPSATNWAIAGYSDRSIRAIHALPGFQCVYLSEKFEKPTESRNCEIQGLNLGVDTGPSSADYKRQRWAARARATAFLRAPAECTTARLLGTDHIATAAFIAAR
jgi:hypothetical protein